MAASTSPSFSPAKQSVALPWSRCCIEELFYVTADKEPSPISLVEAARLPLLVPGPGSGVQHAAQQQFKERGLSVTPIGEIDSVHTLCRAVASGIGNTILPWSALYDGGREITLSYRKFADAKLTRPVALCLSEVAHHGPAINAVASMLRDLVRELVEEQALAGRHAHWRGPSYLFCRPPHRKSELDFPNTVLNAPAQTTIPKGRAQMGVEGTAIERTGAVVSATEGLRVFWMPGCSSCVKVKEFLKKLDIPFNSVNVLTDPNAEADLQAMGAMGFPVVSRGKEFVCAQSLDDVSKFIKRDVKFERLTPAELMERWFYFSDIALTLVDHIPQEHLQALPIPNRNRTLHGLSYHIFQVPEAFLENAENGEEHFDKYFDAPPPDDVKTSADVHAYGDRITDAAQALLAKPARQIIRLDSENVLRHPAVASFSGTLDLAYGAAHSAASTCAGHLQSGPA